MVEEKVTSTLQLLIDKWIMKKIKTVSFRAYGFFYVR